MKCNFNITALKTHALSLSRLRLDMGSTATCLALVNGA